MSYGLNLKLKDNIQPDVLLKYGFVPKYDEDTGFVKEYTKKIHIDGKKPDETYFKFTLYTVSLSSGFFRRRFEYSAWMTGFSWSHICEKEALRLLYDLIIDGIVEPYEKKGA